MEFFIRLRIMNFSGGLHEEVNGSSDVVSINDDYHF
ncbi:Hypothetical protein Bdt_1688 [Bdellovibrio bacteriovorus str. Tiberius]|uniref:Uncharacterized protein n=1 Tax=Bdellovibrio bacteriovorus str. Tiberius TaxID=1069642 RepID=K7YUR6_BDEBC|nr:Hypothetical protein Bdt_1688 [Bdellovibrio bacteriovorus str. Tiberius]